MNMTPGRGAGSADYYGHPGDPDGAHASDSSKPTPDTEASSTPETSTKDDEATPDTPSTPEQGSDDSSDTKEKKGFFGQALKNFTRRFRGEKTEREINEKKLDWENETSEAALDVTEKGSSTIAGMLTSIMGLKAFYDVPAYLTQQFTTRAERTRILNELKQLDKEGEELRDKGEDTADVLNLKLKHIEGIINKSKFLSITERKNLIRSIQEKVNGADSRLKELQKQRNAEITKLLEEAIQTRVKGKEVLKQTVNTALMATGYGMMRGTAYGAMAIWERNKKINAELKKNGETINGHERLHRILFDGYKEAWQKMSTGGNAETWMGRTAIRGLGLVEAVTPALRVAGFANIMADDFLENTTLGQISAGTYERPSNPDEVEGYVAKAYEAIMAKYEDKDSLGGQALNYLFEEEKDPGAGEAEPGVEAPPAGEAEPAGTETADTGTTTTGAEQNDSGISFEDQYDKPVLKTFIDNEKTDLSTSPAFEDIPPDQQELAKVQDSDTSPLYAISRQLRDNPRNFGYSGELEERAVKEWAVRTTIELGKSEGLVNEDLNLQHLTNNAKNLSIVLSRNDETQQLELFYYNDGEQITSREQLNNLNVFSWEATPDSVPASASTDIEPTPTDTTDTADTATADTSDPIETAPTQEPTPDTGSDYEPFDGQKDLARTKKGDGIVRMMTRQLRANPKAFGFDGEPTNSAEVRNWANKLAMETAVEQGIIRASGDTRLATEAIGNLEVMVERGEADNIEIHFRAGGQEMNAEAFRNSEYAYDSEIGPTRAALESVRGSIDSSTTGSEMLKGSPDVPNEFFDNNMVLVENENGLIVGIEWGDEAEAELRTFQSTYDTPTYREYREALEYSGFSLAETDKKYHQAATRLLLLTEGLKQLETNDQLDSGEARFLRIMLAGELNNTYVLINHEDERVQYAIEQAKLVDWTEPTPAPTAAATTAPREVAGPAADTTADSSSYLTRRGNKTIFKSKDGIGNVIGRLTFTDRDTDGALEVSMPARSSDSTIKSAREALVQYGVTHENLRDFDEGQRNTKFDHRIFERNIVRLDRMKELRDLMLERDLSGSREFAAVQAEIARDEARINDQMTEIKAIMKQEGIIEE
jgi:hypothetical protein